MHAQIKSYYMWQSADSYYSPLLSWSTLMIHHPSIKLFANDCILFKAVRRVSDCEGLQADLRNVQTWCAKWQLRLNQSKCKAMNVTNKRNIIPCHYQMNGAAIEKVDSYRYIHLGVIVDNKLKWTHHNKATVARANGTLSLLRRTMFACSRESNIRVYATIVRPGLTYGEPAWRLSTHKAEKTIQRVQKRATRWVDARWLGNENRWNKSFIHSSSSLQWLSLSNSVQNCLTYKILHWVFQSYYCTSSEVPATTINCCVTTRESTQSDIPIL